MISLSFLRIIIIRIDKIRITVILLLCEEEKKMPKKPAEMERVILADGWMLKVQVGSHRQYVHPTKQGKVTIPFHSKDIPKGTENSILKQAGLK